MFLTKTIKTNKKLIDFTINAHKDGLIIPDSYILDVDTILENSKMMLELANNNNVKLFFMLKQIGRNPLIGKKLIELGFAGAVVVDYKEALIMIENGIKIGNVGHLVQVPINLLEKILLSKPEYFTVYSTDILEHINIICQKNNIIQKIMLKVIDIELDNIYEGQSAGFVYKQLEDVAKLSKKLLNIKITGLTAFPCVLVDEKTNKLTPTNNIYTIIKAKEKLEDLGLNIDTLNMPSATSVYSLNLIASLGATHGEPGHGLTGTTPFHNHCIDGEKIGMLYLSEISHSLKDKSYCYGGGHYRRSNVEMALVNNKLVKVYPPSDEAIDYYFGLNGKYRYGDCVIMNFRTQIFVTRSNVILVEGLSKSNPVIIGEYDAQGRKI